jgi:acyl carrier protein
MFHKAQIQDLVYRAMDGASELLLDDTALTKSPDTVLVGDGATLDSMGFINFVVALENELGEEIGLVVNLVEELNTIDEHTLKPSSVADLVAFLQRLLQRRGPIAGPPC